MVESHTVNGLPVRGGSQPKLHKNRQICNMLVLGGRRLLAFYSVALTAVRHAGAACVSGGHWKQWENSGYSDPKLPELQNATIDTLRTFVAAYLHPDDYSWMDAALNTTGSISALLNHPLWQDQRKSRIRAVMSAASFIPHDLNEFGLHALRVILNRRIAERFQTPPPQTELDHKFNASFYFQRLMEDGYVIIPDAEKLASKEGYGLSGAYGVAFDALVEGVTGFSGTNTNAYLAVNKLGTFRHFYGDPQYYMHTDTHMPTLKIWTFPRTKLKQGPFHYVKGSHRVSAAKVKYLVERTRHLSHSFAHMFNGQCDGPYSDKTHAFVPALRVEGLDERSSKNSSVWSNTLAGFPPATALTTDGARSIVIADTGGFHYRGWAPPGTERHSSMGPAGGGALAVSRKGYVSCLLSTDRSPPSGGKMEYHRKKKGNGGPVKFWVDDDVRCPQHGDILHQGATMPS